MIFDDNGPGKTLEDFLIAPKKVSWLLRLLGNLLIERCEWDRGVVLSGDGAKVSLELRMRSIFSIALQGFSDDWKGELIPGYRLDGH